MSAAPLPRPFRPEVLNRLLPALAVVTAPQLPRMPAWLIAVTLAFAAWCYVINNHRLHAPGVVLRSALSVLLLLAVYGHYGSLLGREAGAALLFAMLALKLMEINSVRDLYVAVFLGYFLIIIGFLYVQSPAMAAYMLIGVTLLTAVLADINRPQRAEVMDNLRLAAGLLLRALPLALVLFVLFPRMGGPLWGLPKDAYAGLSGLSDEMAPGRISGLIQSDAVAFRARFDGPIPPPDQRYWRGPVLWDTDGSRWAGGRSASLRSTPPPLVKPGGAVTYTVTLEPHDRRWLFALDLVDRVDRVPATAGITDDFVLLNDRPLRQRLRYTATSWPEGVDQRIDPEERRRALRLPTEGNPWARDLARRWRERYGDPAAVVQQALALFHDQPFIYTLHPPRISGDFIDTFLFDTRKGFCEHYAASFAFLMRAAGIPARVVTGYQGGEVNPVGRYLIVRQRDAHAWTEVWLDGRGWTRVDPTAAVAPERIDHGIDTDTQSAGDAVRFSLPQAGWLPALWREVRFGLDALNNKWNQWVLSYGPEQQARLLQRLSFAGLHWQAAAVLLLTVVGTALLMLVLQLLNRDRRAGDPAQRAYQRFCAKLARHGVVRLAHEGPHTFAARAAARRPELSGAIRLITTLYISLHYSARAPAPALEQLRRAVRRFKT